MTESSSEQSAVMSSADIHDLHGHSTTVHPHNTPGPEFTSNQSQSLLGMPTLQNQLNLRHYQLNTLIFSLKAYISSKIVDYILLYIDLSKQELVVFKDGSVTTNIKQAIEEKTNEIQQLEI